MNPHFWSLYPWPILDELGLSENRVYSHLIGIMISKTIGYNGVHNIFRHTQLSMMTCSNFWSLYPKKVPMVPSWWSKSPRHATDPETRVSDAAACASDMISKNIAMISARKMEDLTWFNQEKYGSLWLFKLHSYMENGPFIDNFPS